MQILRLRSNWPSLDSFFGYPWLVRLSLQPLKRALYYSSLLDLFLVRSNSIEGLFKVNETLGTRYNCSLLLTRDPHRNQSGFCCCCCHYFFFLSSFFLSLWYAKERPLKKNIANKFSLGLVGQKEGKGEFCLLMQLTFRISDLVITCLINWATEHWVFLSIFGGESGSRRCLNGTYYYQSKLPSVSFKFFC